MKIQSVGELAARAASDPALAAQLKADPVATLSNVAAPPLATDVVIYRMVVGALGAAVIIAVVGAIFLQINGKTTPELLTAIGSAAIGALAGLLAPPPRT